MNGKYCYLNGKIVPAAKARVHPEDIGFLRGYGVFEFLRTYGERPFLCGEHIKRLKNSAKLLNLKLPLSEQELKTAINKIISKNGFKNSTVRIILTGGKTKDGMTFDSPSLLILAGEFKHPPAGLTEKGIKLITLEHQRELPEAKTLNYVSAVRLYNARAKKEGAFEILYTHNGRVLECSTSNFFIFSEKISKGGKSAVLVTPKKGVLKGVTRNLVVRLAREKFKVEEREIETSELKSAKEAFITATNKEIIPVARIGARKIGNGKVGENTEILMKMFKDYVSKFKK